MSWVDEQDMERLRRKEYLFWSSITIIEDFPEDCWLWWKSTTSQGYGKIHTGSNDEGKQVIIYAHRFSYLLLVGPIPEGKICLHKCDEPRCCNPSHLFIGTKKDNSQDMMRKGRGKSQIPKGNQSWVGRKHTEETKKKISEAKTGTTMSEETRKKMSESQRRRWERE